MHRPGATAVVTGRPSNSNGWLSLQRHGRFRVRAHGSRLRDSVGQRQRSVRLRHVSAPVSWRSPLEKDICDLSVAGDRLAPVDLVAGGFPCQSFSQAGDRRGFDDPRGRLFFEVDRLLRELDELTHRPRLVVLENVPHLLYGADGKWFDEVRRRLRHAGYWFRAQSCWTVNVKDATDVPQDRERLFMVAASREHFSHNPFSPPSQENLARPTQSRAPSLVDRRRRADAAAYLPPDNRYYKMIAAAMARGKSDRNLYQLRRSYVREKLDGLCPTLTANMGIGGHNVPFVRDRWGIRRLPGAGRHPGRLGLCCAPEPDQAGACGRFVKFLVDAQQWLSSVRGLRGDPLQ